MSRDRKVIKTHSTHTHAHAHTHSHTHTCTHTKMGVLLFWMQHTILRQRPTNPYFIIFPWSWFQKSFQEQSMGCAASIKRSISLGRLDDTVLPAIELKDRLKTRGGHRSWMKTLLLRVGLVVWQPFTCWARMIPMVLALVTCSMDFLSIFQSPI